MNSSRLELTSSLDRSSPYQGSPNRAEPIPSTWFDGQFDDPCSWCLLYLWFFDNFSCKCFCSYRDIFAEINCYTAIVICTAVTRDPRTASSADWSVRDSTTAWYVDPRLLLFSAEWFSLNPDLRLLNAEISVIKNRKNFKFFQTRNGPNFSPRKKIWPKNENRPVQEMPKGVSNHNQATIDILKQGSGWLSSVEKYNEYFEGSFNNCPVRFAPDFRLPIN